MRLLLCGLLALALPSIAQAQQLDDPDTQISKRHFQEGQQLYSSGRYKEAADAFVAAYKVKPAAALLFNAARAFDRAEMSANALHYYDAFLAAGTSDAASVAEARARVSLLRPRVAVTSTPPSRPRHWWVGPLVVGLLGVAVLGAGAGLYGASRAEYDHLSSTCAPGCATSRWHDDRDMQQAGIALMPIGGAAIVAASAWAIVASKRGHRAQARLRLDGPFALGGAF